MTRKKTKTTGGSKGKERGPGVFKKTMFFKGFALKILSDPVFPKWGAGVPKIPNNRG